MPPTSAWDISTIVWSFDGVAYADSAQMCVTRILTLSLSDQLPTELYSLVFEKNVPFSPNQLFKVEDDLNQFHGFSDGLWNLYCNSTVHHVN